LLDSLLQEKKRIKLQDGVDPPHFALPLPSA